MEALIKRSEYKRALDKQLVEYLISLDELLDDDGYPTDDALTIVEKWPWEDAKGWFDFINGIWAMKSYGWAEGEAPHDYRPGETVYKYDISTAGWSGNESIIRAMEQNDMLWHTTWVQSRRGGHYIFELSDQTS